MMRTELLGPVLCLCLVGCSQTGDDGVETSESVPLATTASAPGQLDTRTALMWSRSCALCHVDGNAGAPRLGDTEQWQLRLQKGEETLLRHTVEGFNDMPPLGYCMACENRHFVAMIRFMTAGVEAGADSGIAP